MGVNLFMKRISPKRPNYRDEEIEICKKVRRTNVSKVKSIKTREAKRRTFASSLGRGRRPRHFNNGGN